MKPALSADRRNTSRLDSSASATAVFPKPQGALKKKNAPLPQKTVKLLLNGRFYDDVVLQACPSLAPEWNCPVGGTLRDKGRAPCQYFFRHDL